MPRTGEVAAALFLSLKTVEFPSSKTGSGCGWRNPSLTLSDRTFHCRSCGLVADRDLNAAVNLRNLVAGSGRRR